MRRKFFLFIFLILFSSFVFADILPNNIISYKPNDANVNGLTLIDSALNYNATIIGGASCGGGFCQYEDDEYLRINNANLDWRDDTSGTFISWVNSGDLATDYNSIFSSTYDGAVTSYFRIMYEDTDIFINIQDSSGNIVLYTINHVFDEDRDYMISLVSNSTHLMTYVNNTLIDTRAETDWWDNINQTADRWSNLGASYTGVGYNRELLGKQNYFGYWENQALTQTELSLIYSKGKDFDIYSSELVVFSNNSFQVGDSINFSADWTNIDGDITDSDGYCYFNNENLTYNGSVWIYEGTKKYTYSGDKTVNVNCVHNSNYNFDNSATGTVTINSVPLGIVDDSCPSDKGIGYVFGYIGLMAFFYVMIVINELWLRMPIYDALAGLGIIFISMPLFNCNQIIGSCFFITGVLVAGRLFWRINRPNKW